MGQRYQVARDGFLAIIRQFTPNWFTATMGTGVVALVLNQFPIAIPGLHAAGTVIWLGNVLLFALCSLAYLARWLIFPKEAARIFGHSVMPLFLGAIPMGLATIVNGFLAFGQPLIGEAAVGIALVLWWVDAAMALACGLIVPFLMFTRQDHSLERMTAVWLLPIVAAEVTAASGAQLLPSIVDPHAALGLLMFCYGLWAYSVPLALSILVLLFLRMALHKLPTRDLAPSGFLALGPIGTGALGLLLLGAAGPRVLAAAGLPMAGTVASGFGLIGGLLLWAYGVWWLLLAVLTVGRAIRAGMPFTIGWWGLTFPVGVYTLATLTLGRQTGLGFFAVAGGVLAAALTAAWVTVAVRTLRGALDRSLFVSPCLVRGAIASERDWVERV